MTSLPLAHSTGAVLLASNVADKMPPDHLKMLKEEFARSMEALTATLRKQAEESAEIMQESGIKILPRPAEQDMKEFYKVHHRVAQSLAGKIYSKDLLDRVYGILSGVR
jgi:TRAP-type C4-dicarboxylate transport system substrate-binding protein